MRILCCGDRDWDSISIIERELSKYPLDTIIIHGCAHGADTLAGEVAKRLGMSVIEFPAQWKLYGRAAGPIRNRQMLDEGKPDLVIAFHTDLEHSKGTKNMLNQAHDRRISWQLITE